jgi:hypothetical protein
MSKWTLPGKLNLHDIKDRSIKAGIEASKHYQKHQSMNGSFKAGVEELLQGLQHQSMDSSIKAEMEA